MPVHPVRGADGCAGAANAHGAGGVHAEKHILGLWEGVTENKVVAWEPGRIVGDDS
ncbi:hypothetical protein [Gelria sp. Kuro-4]|uniref:hypothetical protein n=1 Tax=Gelria sp. Kuro-4 TaxID=2796927 RepID=UPI001BEFCDB6|nr:hypothetical protein [Gelria sp. Kuro-4]BCV26041.1 hypothetical protein kuro4_28140 [Gelria sp. Kuro-4]